MKQVIEAMKTNTVCKNLSMANIDMPDSVAKVNLESFYVKLNFLIIFVFLKDNCRNVGRK